MSRIHALLLAVLLALSTVGSLALFGPYTGDSERYMRLAENLARGNGFSAALQAPYQPEIFRPPSYPLFMAALIRLGLGVHGFIATQVALYLLAIWLSMKIATMVTGDRLTATLLGTLLAVYPPLVRWAASVTAESLCTALFCGFSWYLVKHLLQPSWLNTVGLGLSVGALSLTRTTYLVLVPVVLLISLIRCRRQGGVRFAVALVVIVLASTGAWLGRNLAVVPSSFVPLGIGSGMALWGRVVELEEPRVDRRTASIAGNSRYQIAHEGTEPELQAKADADLFREAIVVIRARWIEFAALTLWLIAVREWVEAYDPRLPTFVLWLATGASGALLLMAYLGVILVRSRWALALPLAGVCVAVAAAHAPFATEARYTAPVRPMLYIFSAYAAACGVRAIGRLTGKGDGPAGRIAIGVVH